VRVQVQSSRRARRGGPPAGLHQAKAGKWAAGALVEFAASVGTVLPHGKVSVYKWEPGFSACRPDSASLHHLPLPGLGPQRLAGQGRPPPGNFRPTLLALVGDSDA
jgi:hypothetical protein